MDLLVEAELRRASARPGCLLCRVGEEAATRYLRSVLHEGVNDGATRTRLDRSWGFCRRHAWHFLGLEWESMHDSLSMATLSEGLVGAAEEILEAFLDAAPPRSRRRRAAQAPLEGLARALAPAEPCPACQVQAEHERYAATVLVTALEDPGWRRRFMEYGGLCLAHFRGAVTAEEAPERLRWLIEDHRRRLRELRSDLEEYGRKHDYRFSQERYGREADAPVRATQALAGSWFDLPRRPRAAVEPEGGVASTKKEGSRGRTPRELSAGGLSGLSRSPPGVDRMDRLARQDRRTVRAARRSAAGVSGARLDDRPPGRWVAGETSSRSRAGAGRRRSCGSPRAC